MEANKDKIDEISIEFNFFSIIAETKDRVIMGIKHKSFPFYGVQFHPESIATEYGHKLLKNFLEIYK